MTKPMRLRCPIIDSRDFFDVLPSSIIFFILADQAMCLCLEGVTVRVLKLKWHPRITFVSDNPPSALNFSRATIALQGIGLFSLFGWAVTLIASGIAALGLLAFLVLGRSTVSPVLSSMLTST
jgi:hypothetical protein